MIAVSSERRSLRGAVSVLFRIFTTVSAIAVTGVLVWVLATLLWKGVGALSWATAGLVHAMIGSLTVVALAFIMAVPVGVVAGVFISEVGRNSRLLPAVHFVADVLSGMPAVVAGVCSYLLLARIGLGQSLFSGALALGALMMPVVACTTSRMLEEISPELREAALVLGTPTWRILLQISLRAAAPGILSAGLLAVARVAGEVAPLLLTMPTSPTLHVEAYRHMLVPESESLAWTAALLLTVAIMAMVFIAHRLGRGQR